MFGNKTCPNCNMKIKVGGRKFITCPFCDAELTVLTNGKLADIHQHSNSHEEVSHTSPSLPIQKKAPLQPLSKPSTYDSIKFRKNRSQLVFMIVIIFLIIIFMFPIGMFFPLLFRGISLLNTNSNLINEIKELPFSNEEQYSHSVEDGDVTLINNYSSGFYSDITPNKLEDEPIVRTEPSSLFMSQFVESIFHRPVDRIDESDYQRVTSFRIKKLEPLHSLESEGSFIDYSIEYTLDGKEFSYYFDSYSTLYDAEPRPLENEDLTIFPNLEVLELNYYNNENSNVLLQGVLDLRSLKKLHTFIPQHNITLNEAIETLADPSNIRSLGFCLDKADDLQDLAELFPNLENLSILNFNDSHSDFTPITALKNLKSLSTFMLEDNDYLRDLHGLEELTIEDYYYNEEYDFLNELTSLKTLSMHYSDFKQMEEVPFLPSLEEVRLYEPDNINFHALAKMGNIKKLYIDGNSYMTLDDISELTDLEELFLYNYTHIEFENGLPSLENLTKLQKLTIPYDYHHTIGNLTTLKELTLFNPEYTEDTDVSDVDCFLNIPNIETLNLHGFAENEMLQSIYQLSKLKNLNISNATLNQIPFDSYLLAPSLESIRMVSCYGDLVVNDMSIRNENIKELNLNTSSLEVMHSNVSDINLGFDTEFFSTMPNLKSLKMNSFGITDLDFIQVLPNLEILDISKAYIDDYNPLHSLPSLKTLYYSSEEDLDLEEDIETINLYY